MKSNNHTYQEEGPYQDPHLKPIMDSMGFSVPSGTLVFTRKEADDEEDSLVAALILLLASEQT